MIALPNDLYQKLEFDRILTLLESLVNGSLGAEKVHAIHPTTDRTRLERDLTHTAQMKKALEERLGFPMRAYQSINEDVRMLRIEDFVLSLDALNRVQTILGLSYALFQFFRLRGAAVPALASIMEGLTFLDVAYAAMRRILDEEGKVRADASPELMRLRRAANGKRREIDQRFRGIVNEFGQKGYLADTLETLRNGRRVLAVLAEYKRTVRGIIHDESTTGRTTYIEPEGVIELNNDLIDIEAEETREIWRILRDLCRQLHPHTETLDAYQEAIATFDFLHAKAELAIRIGGILPDISDTPTIQLHNAVHPVLYLRNKLEKRKTVPFTLTMRDPNRILVLSGPNAGGKSVTMKSVGLIQLMFQCGMLVPAKDGTTMGIFTHIFGDIGDRQSLDDDLSTYSSRLQLTKTMLDAADPHTLVLIDEFGAGTDPKMGGSIAEAALRALNERGVWGVITTHYSNLKMFAYKTKGLLNGAMTFDKDTLSPRYELRVGRPGSSYAFEIAQKSGWDEGVLAYAKQRTGESETAVDQLLIDLQQEKQELTDRLATARDKETKLDTLIKSYEAAFRELEFGRKRLKMQNKEQELQQTAQVNKDLERIMRQIQEERNLERARELAEQNKLERARLAEEVKALDETLYQTFEKKAVQAGELAAGDYVRIRNGGAIGTVESVKKNEAVVISGMMRLSVKLRDLERVEEPIRRDLGKIRTDTVESHARFAPHLDIRGMSREEAFKNLEDFIDDALMASSSTIRIVHGKGNGTLRQAVKEKLREYGKAIRKAYHPEENDGGMGVTLIDL